MSKITDREQEILSILKNDPMISQEELAELVGITRSAVAVHISNLIKKGYILGRGYVFNEKTGVLVVGSVFVDVKAKEGRTEKADIEIETGGSGFEIACDLAKLNIPVSLVSVLGRDSWGETAAVKLKNSGVDTRYLIMTKDTPTPRRVVLKEEGKFEKVFSDKLAIEALNEANLQNLAVTVKNAGMLVIDSEIPLGTTRYLTNLAKETGIRTCIRLSDDSPAGILAEDFQGGFLAVMTHRLAEKLAGVEIRDLSDGLNAGRLIASKGLEWVSVIIPEQGVAMSGISNEGFSVPLPPGQIESKGISLDRLTAGLISGFLKEFDLRRNVRVSLGMAALNG